MQVERNEIQSARGPRPQTGGADELQPQVTVKSMQATGMQRAGSCTSGHACTQSSLPYQTGSQNVCHNLGEFYSLAQLHAVIVVHVSQCMDGWGLGRGRAATRAASICKVIARCMQCTYMQRSLLFGRWGLLGRWRRLALLWGRLALVRRRPRARARGWG